MVRVLCAVLHPAGQVVVQVQQCRRAPLARIQVQRLLRILKKDVRVVLVMGVEVKKSKVQPAAAVLRGLNLCRQAMACEARRSFPSGPEEHCHARYQQCPRQPLHDGVEQRGQVGLRAQPPAKLDQRLAVVVFVPVEDPVHPPLDAPLQRLKECRHQHNGDRFAPVPRRRRQPVVRYPAAPAITPK